MADMPEPEFVGESIVPVAETMDAGRMARGEPGLPRRFRWRGAEHEIVAVIGTSKSTGDCSHGSGEQYVRRHWYDVRTRSGDVMRLSFDRSARTPAQLRTAWRIVSIVRAPAEGAGATS